MIIPFQQPAKKKPQPDLLDTARQFVSSAGSNNESALEALAPEDFNPLNQWLNTAIPLELPIVLEICKYIQEALDYVERNESRKAAIYLSSAIQLASAIPTTPAAVWTLLYNFTAQVAVLTGEPEEAVHAFHLALSHSNQALKNAIRPASRASLYEDQADILLRLSQLFNETKLPKTALKAKSMAYRRLQLAGSNA